MKVKKYTDPRIKAEALARAITKLGDAAAKARRASVELKDATEAALKKMGKVGVDGAAALAIVTVICEPLLTCQRCGAERPEREMTNWRCIECTAALHRIERSKQFS
jgi:triphosphoribosyl-dephospho-CoA synthetase